MGYASASITLTSSGPSQMSLEKATEKRGLRPPFERGKIPKGACTSYAREQLLARRQKRRRLCKACALLFLALSGVWHERLVQSVSVPRRSCLRQSHCLLGESKHSSERQTFARGAHATT